MVRLFLLSCFGDKIIKPLLTGARWAVQILGASSEKHELGVLSVAINNGTQGIIEGHGGNLLVPDGDELISGPDGAILLSRTIRKGEDEDAAIFLVILLENDSHGLWQFHGNVITFIHRINEVGGICEYLQRAFGSASECEIYAFPTITPFFNSQAEHCMMGYTGQVLTGRSNLLLFLSLDTPAHPPVDRSLTLRVNLAFFQCTENVRGRKYINQAKEKGEG